MQTVDQVKTPDTDISTEGDLGRFRGGRDGRLQLGIEVAISENQIEMFFYVGRQAGQRDAF